MNTLHDFHKGVKVLWDLRDGQYVEGEAIYVTSAGNVGCNGRMNQKVRSMTTTTHLSI